MLTKKAVVCDDDALVRSVVGDLLTASGFEIAAEVDDELVGFDQIVATGADVVVLDLALRAGHGEHLLQRIVQDHPDVKVVVFSSYVSDPMRLLDAGASAVVEKPDFGRLEEVVRNLAEGTTVVDQRRPTPRESAVLPPSKGSTLSGLEAWESFTAAVDALAPGDSILAFDVLPTGSLESVWDHVHRLDYRLAVARAAAHTGRDQDRVSISPEGYPIMLVVAGHAEAPAAVYDRIVRVWKREVAAGSPVAAFGHVVEGTSPRTTMGRTIAKVQHDDFSIEHPLRFV